MDPAFRRGSALLAIYDVRCNHKTLTINEGG